MEEKELREWKEKTVTRWIKKGGFYHLFIWNAKAERQIWTYPTKCHPPPPICIERTAGVVWRLRLVSCMELHRPPWASSSSHISLNMWELWAEARHTALTAPARFQQLCITKMRIVAPSAVCWSVRLCFYTNLINEPMQWDCSAGFKDQTLNQFCWHDWSRHELWWSKKSFCINNAFIFYSVSKTSIFFSDEVKFSTLS